ncbi:MAG: heavy metal sensor histidine kinase [Holophaga sp.]|nr:heavy metal sensor histidine kinase [Holophaga sp.]
MWTEPRGARTLLGGAKAAGDLLAPLRGSLRLRLAMTFALGSMAALVVVSGFTYWAFKREIQVRNRRLLQGRIQEVAAVLQQGSRSSLEDEVLGEGAASTDPKVWLRVLAGAVVTIESHGMGESLPVRCFATGGRTRWQSRSYDLEERPVGRYRIQGALETTEDDGLILSYRHRLLYVLLTGTTGCALFGWWAANRGLRPIRAIEDSTRTITAHRLQERLQPADVPQELRALVHALNAMLDRLEQAFSRLSQFSADLAHELRTPITNLMGEAEVTLSCNRSGEEYRQVLESSLEEYRRLSRLITRMLFLARTEDPQTAIKHGAIEPRRLVDEVLAYFEASAEEQAVRLEGHAEGSLSGDADLLRQALANLMSNALQATPRGGAILVSIQSAPQGSEILVRDTGCGIPAAELEGVCDRFARTRASLDGKAVGTGLGLAIVHSIARLHGGFIRIESEPGLGTTVRLLLP